MYNLNLFLFISYLFVLIAVTTTYKHYLCGHIPYKMLIIEEFNALLVQMCITNKCKV
jgi:hypothetical protein